MRVACHALRRMRGLPLNLALGLALCLTQAPGIAGAMDFSDPDWPCIQRKVENLSASLMWPAPVTRTPLSPEATDLVEALSLRRVSLEEADAHVRAFVERNKQADGQLLGNIFYGVFDNIAETRQRLIAGIARYSRSQIALSSRIEGARVEMAKLSREKSPISTVSTSWRNRSTGTSAFIAIARRRSPMSAKRRCFWKNAPMPSHRCC